MGGRSKSLLGVGFSLVLLGLLIFWQPRDAYVEVWRQVVLWPVAIAYALTLPMVLLRAWQTSCLARLQKMRVGFAPLVALQLATSFYSLFVPGIVAVGVVRWYRLARLGGDPDATLALVVFSRLLEIEMALLLGLLFWLADPAAPGSPILPLAFAGLLLTTALARLWIFRPRSAERAQALMSACWPDGRLTWLRSRLAAMLRVTGRYGALTGAAWTTLLTNILASHALGLLCAGLIALALGMEVDWATLGWARALLALAMLFPIAWAGIGLREATMAGALVAAGQPAAASVALGLLLSLRLVIEAAAGGLVELQAWLTPSFHQKS